MPIKIVHCKKEAYDVYIGRPSKWGNPYSHKDGTLAMYKVSSREEAVERYKEYLMSNADLLRDLWELKDKTLGCWCSPMKCHGDILKELVDNL